VSLDWTEYIRGRRFVGPEGSGRNGVLLLGEAPGAREDETGRPFVGDAGWQLEHTLALVRELDKKNEFLAARDDFAIHNVVQFRPPNNWLEGAPWERAATLHGAISLEETINRVRPRVIVPVGNVASASRGPRWMGRCEAGVPL
jgi:DNA polymerase